MQMQGLQGLHPAQLFALMGHAFPGAMQVLIHCTSSTPIHVPPRMLRDLRACGGGESIVAA